MKRMAFILSAFILTFSLTACGGKNSSTSMTNSENNTGASASAYPSESVQPNVSESGITNPNGVNDTTAGAAGSGVAGSTTDGSGITSGVSGAAENASENAAGMVSDAAGNTAEMARNGFSSAAEGAGRVAEDVTNGIGSIADGAMNAGRDVIDDITGNYENDTDYHGTLGDVDGDGFVVNYR